MPDFKTLWSMGYRRLVPIIPPDAAISERSTLHKRIGTKQDGRGKTPGTRSRDGLWSSFDWSHYESTPEDLPRWQGMGAGVGIKCGAGLVAIDADTLNLAHAKTIRDIVERRFGPLPARVGRNPKCLYVLRTASDLPYMRVEFGDERVELLTEGRQFVAQGIHPVTGKPYTWPRELVAFDALPVFSPDEIRAAFEEMRAALPAASQVITEGAGNDVSQGGLKGDLDLVRKAVRATPNTSATFASRESYLQYGYAIKAALPDDEPAAFDLFQDWCSRWTDGENEPDVVAADWRRMKPPFRRGAPWLYELAGAEAVWFEPITEIELNPFDIGPAEKPTRLLELVTLQEAAATALTASNRPLIKGLLDQGTLSVMYGPSNVGKTFVALAVFFHIAAGMAWGDMKTHQGRVVYVAAEGGGGARKRADALMRRYAGKVGLNAFYLHLASIDLLRSDADLEPLIATLLAIGPVCAVGLDTLSRVMAGGEENSSVDMGTLVKNIDRIRKATGAHVMLVHHSGKDQARGARGHSLLRAATDTEIEIAEGQIAVTKQRDLDKTYSSAFRLDVVQLGVDEDGAPVTSCTVELVRRHAEPTSPLTPKEQTVLEALNALADGVKGVRVVDVAAFLADADMSADTVRAHLKNLAKKHAVTCPARGLWAPRMDDMSVFGQVVGSEVEENASSTSVFRQDVGREVEESGRKKEGTVFE